MLTNYSALLKIVSIPECFQIYIRFFLLIQCFNARLVFTYLIEIPTKNYDKCFPVKPICE